MLTGISIRTSARIHATALRDYQYTLSVILRAHTYCCSAYKNTQALVRLAGLLTKPSPEVTQRIVTMVAKTAFTLRDYPYTLATCEKLMQSNYGPAWEVCDMLGKCEEFADQTNAKRQLVMRMLLSEYLYTQLCLPMQ